MAPRSWFRGRWCRGLAAAGYLGEADSRRSVVGVWRAPEQLRRAPEWRAPGSPLIDVQLFGEIGLAAARREPTGRPAPIPHGPLLAPRGADSALALAEVATSVTGTLALRGPMGPVSMFLPGVERTSLPRFAAGADGFVDTGYACEGGRAPGTLVVSGAPAGLVSFGGYRFAIRELADVVSGLDPTGTLAARPDVLAGQRLAGAAANHEAIRMALRGIGANPLLVEAFGSRPRPGPERPPA
jgi:hypothetical protein